MRFFKVLSGLILGVSLELMGCLPSLALPGMLRNPPGTEKLTLYEESNQMFAIAELSGGTLITIKRLGPLIQDDHWLFVSVPGTALVGWIQDRFVCQQLVTKGTIKIMSLPRDRRQVLGRVPSGFQFLPEQRMITLDERIWYRLGNGWLQGKEVGCSTP